MSIIVENFSFGYTSEHKVLQNLSFQIAQQEVIAIVGASGSGKSTFLRFLCGIIEAKESSLISGSVTINDLSPKKYTQSGAVGFMFQEATLFPNLTVEENITLPLKLKKQIDKSKVKELVSKVGLANFSDYLPKNLSGGMRTRTALARTFITKPDLILLDEPFSSLDIRWRFLLYQELEKLRQTYLPTIIIVTHDIQEALLLSNHILVFGQGGKILDEIRINKPLPRVFQTDVLRNLQDEYLKIQNLIMENAPLIDDIRDEISKEQVYRLLDEIENNYHDNSKVNELTKKLLLVRKFSHEQDIHERLIKLWEITNEEFQYTLLWDILNYEELSHEWHEKIYQYMINCAENQKQVFIQRMKEFDDLTNTLTFIEKRIDNPQIPATKKWIYLCLLISPKLVNPNEAKQKLESIIDNNHYKNYPFTQEVASRLLAKYFSS